MKLCETILNSLFRIVSHLFIHEVVIQTVRAFDVFCIEQGTVDYTTQRKPAKRAVQ